MLRHAEGEIQGLAGAFGAVEFCQRSNPHTPPGAERLLYLFDSQEGCAAFRFPAPALEESPGVQLKTTRTQLAPATVSDTGQLIGNSRHNGREWPVHLSTSDRRRHVYAVGQTGTGKTTMFESMILADARAGEGLCVVDPHGDLIEQLLRKIPEERAGDVILKGMVTLRLRTLRPPVHALPQGYPILNASEFSRTFDFGRGLWT